MRSTSFKLALEMLNTYYLGGPYTDALAHSSEELLAHLENQLLKLNDRYMKLSQGMLTTATLQRKLLIPLRLRLFQILPQSIHLLPPPFLTRTLHFVLKLPFLKQSVIFKPQFINIR